MQVVSKQKGLNSAQCKQGCKPLRLITAFCVILLLSACGAGDSSQTSTEDIDPQALVREAVENLQMTDAFGLLVEQVGIPFNFLFQLGPDQPEIVTTLSRIEGGFIAPDIVHGSARLSINGAGVSIDIFAEETRQWLKALGSDWLNFSFASGFDPSTLLQDGRGFDAAVSRVENLELVGQEQLFGQDTFHVRGEAAGEVVNDLLFGLIEITEEQVSIDLYINTETQLPTYLVVTIPDTAADGEGDTAWNIELFDFDIIPELDTPAGVTLETS